MPTNYEVAFAERPEVYDAWMQLNGSIKESMDLRRYELATLAAARRLRSSYCCLAHGTVLAERFTYFVGCPPMLYLTRWRMQLAASRLATGSAPVIEVASEVGYESEAAFCRAFKKVTGVTPASWRSRRAPRPR